MTSYPLLEFTDGTAAGTVSLLEPFFKVESRRMTIVQAKGGGTWQSSPLAEGRRLVNRQRGNAIETIELSASAATQDSWAHQLQELERLMEKAVQYWTAAWQNTPVYWVDKAGCETERRYALIYDYAIPGLDQILREPFAGKTPGMVNFSISIERGNWLANPPGDEACIEISGMGGEGHETDDIFYPVLHSDDGSYDNSPAMTLTSNSNYMGNAIANLEYDGLVRFQNVTIPQGSIITTALVRYEAAANDGGAPVLSVKVQDDADTDTLTTTTDWEARDLSAGIAWNPGAWVMGNQYDTPSLVSLIQLIINKPDWQSGNSIVVAAEDNGSPLNIHREFYSIVDGVGAPAELHITYISSKGAGRSATCDAEVYIANKHNYKGLTHVWYDDGGVFSANLLGSGTPYNLLPAVPAVNDVLYFGIEDGPLSSITGGGPFFSLVFDLSAGQTGCTFGNGWEFWNGGAWAALTVADNTDDGGQPLDTTGVNSVHWQEESTWAANAVNAVTGYWVRLIVTAAAAPTPPTQQNRDVYTTLWPYVETDEGQVLGDIEALLRAALDNQARYGTDADIARVIMALRSNERGLNFTPYLNCSDQQEIPAIDATADAPATITTSAQAPTERIGRWSPGGAVAMARRWKWTFQDVGSSVINPTLQWYGSYHAFARVDQTAGAVDDFELQLTIDIGDQTYNSSNSPASVKDVDFPEIVDLGRIDIPDGTGVLTGDERLETLIIEIHASSQGAGTLDFYDLILMPADEMLIDAQIKTEKTDGGAVAQDETLSIDSTTNPKATIRSLTRDTTGRVLSIWRTKGALAFLQSNADQRLWFLLMNWDTGGTTDGWAGRFSMGARMQAFNNARYLSLRGER